MYKCPHLGACYNTTTNIRDNFFISKIFLTKSLPIHTKKPHSSTQHAPNPLIRLHILRNTPANAHPQPLKNETILKTLRPPCTRPRTAVLFLNTITHQRTNYLSVSFF